MTIDDTCTATPAGQESARNERSSTRSRTRSGSGARHTKQRRPAVRAQRGLRWLRAGLRRDSAVSERRGNEGRDSAAPVHLRIYYTVGQ